MISRELAAFLSTLISELLILLLILTPSLHPLSITSDSNSDLKFFHTLFPLIHQFLSSSEIAASLSLLPISRKRKRPKSPESDTDTADEEKDGEIRSRIGRFAFELGLDRLVRNPDSFKVFFKMSSSTFEWLSGLLEPLLECRDPGGSPLNLSPEIRLGVGIYRLATGSDYAEVSNRFKVSEFVAKFCVKQLCRVLCTNFRFWVGFPNQDELESVTSGFKTLTGLPNCCGVITCTRFTISKSLEKDDEGETIAAQFVVDSSSRILSIFAGSHGGKDDYSVLRSSTLYKDIQNGKLLNSNPISINGVDVNQYFIGDGNYPLLPWLMVPFLTPTQDSYEEIFNKNHNVMRISSNKTISCLKNWGVLSRPIKGEFKTAVAYIAACSILHNALLERDDLGEFSVSDHRENLHYDSEINMMEKKASVIRNVLAGKIIQDLNSMDQNE